MTVHREEGCFNVRIELSAEFDEEYEGDDDGNAWLQRWQERVRPKLVQAIFVALRTDPAFDVVPVSRGATPDENLEIAVTLRKAR